MQIRNGSLIIASWHGAPIMVHWTVILGALFFGRFEFVPVFWIAFFALVLIHELGHALMVRRFSLWLDEIVIHGLGGYCRWSGEATEIQRSIIAWGGVGAQFIVLIAATIAFFSLGSPQSFFAAQLCRVFIYTNLWIIFLNLIPISPLDGAAAWKILRIYYRSIRDNFRKRKHVNQYKTMQNKVQKIIDAEERFRNRKKVHDSEKL